MVKRFCRICGGGEFKEVIDFGPTPLVNSLLSKEELGEEALYHLKVEQCQNCRLVQIVDPVDSNKIYKEVDYLYFSSDMPNLSEYFKQFAEDIKEKYLLNDDLVVEIGSNDGVMLKHFMDKYRVLGVDPASNVVVRALRHGIPTLSEFFTCQVASQIAREFSRAAVIYGNNCIAHLSDLHDLMRGVKVLLQQNGVFIVECNYWGAMVKNINYSLIYHDHFSYFTLANWIDIANRYGMTVVDARVTSAQGGSLRVVLRNGTDVECEDSVKDLLDEEVKFGLADYNTCIDYRNNVIKAAGTLRDTVLLLKDQGKKIAGYGAAAKGFTILQLSDIGPKELDYIVDDSPAKQNKFTPVTHIPVKSRASIKGNLPDYFLITAPNYASVIMKKEAEFAEAGGKFILADSSIV